MARPSTDLLVTETLTPTVQTPADFRAALIEFLPLLSRVSQQAAAAQALANVAEIDETDEAIRQKLVGYKMSLASIQAKHDKALDIITSLQRAVDANDFEARELERVVNRPEDPPEDPSPPISS